MTNEFLNVILNLFSSVLQIRGGREVLVFFISALPILELRGGIFAASMLKIKPIIAFFLCLFGNMILIPFILYFITPIFKRLKQLSFWKKKIESLEQHALSKKESVERFQFWGLLFFVAIPLPGTGAFTGALLAALLDMKKGMALCSIFLGVFFAGMIMLFFSYGLFDFFL